MWLTSANASLAGDVPLRCAFRTFAVATARRRRRRSHPRRQASPPSSRGGQSLLCSSKGPHLPLPCPSGASPTAAHRAACGRLAAACIGVVRASLGPHDGPTDGPTDGRSSANPCRCGSRCGFPKVEIASGGVPVGRIHRGDGPRRTGCRGVPAFRPRLAAKLIPWPTRSERCDGRASGEQSTFRRN